MYETNCESVLLAEPTLHEFYKGAQKYILIFAISVMHDFHFITL